MGNELAYMSEAIKRGQVSGDGYFTRKCHKYLERALGVPRVLLTTSCTDALELAALLLNLRSGDEIIASSFTFVSTVNAFVLRGARPVFIDIHPDTLNMDESQIEESITPRTKAIIPMHYAGIGCEMDAITQIARHHKIKVIEDNAHGIFGKYKGKYLGTFGSLAVQSFHETKNFICGEGGALLINEPSYIARAEILREKGTNRTRFFRGQVDKYTWVDIGSSFLPSDLLAAFLYAQLERRKRIQQLRQSVWNYYYKNLKEWAEKNDVQLPFIPKYCKQSYHMFYLILPSHKAQRKLIQLLASKKILSVFHYLPLHLSPMGREFGGKKGDCPVTESVSKRLLRLPFYNNLSVSEQDRIIATVTKFSAC